ncbi:MAG: DNA translocase FtsK [Burkholderiaceae bacterium]
MSARQASRPRAASADRRRPVDDAGAHGLVESTRSVLTELAWLVWAALAVLLVLSLSSWSAQDNGWFQAGAAADPTNWLGRVGAWVSDIFYFFFGLSAFWWAGLFALLAVLSFQESYAVRRATRMGLEPPEEPSTDLILDRSLVRLAGFGLLLASSAVLEAQRLDFLGSEAAFFAGGVVGNFLGGGIDWLLGPMGVTVLGFIGFFLGLSFALGFGWMALFERIGFRVEWIVKEMQQAYAARRDRAQGQTSAEARAVIVRVKKESLPEHVTEVMPVAEVKASRRAAQDREASRQKPLFDTLAPDGELIPSLGLLDAVDARQEPVSAETLAYTSRLIELRLADFGVTVRVVSAQPGPVITRYEIEPAVGVKGSQIVNLARDLARALSLTSVRVVETLPGKSLMGLELPNPRRQTVRLSEILGSTAFQSSGAALPLALGKDIAGAPFVVDLARMPHLLVAGTTGSGKSVGVNAMLLSLLYHAPAERIRLILIDPKMLELSIYEGIPHLLTPVVTDMKLAANALHWCVGEMERRYRLMSKLNTRNLAGFNQKVEDAAKRGQPLLDPLAHEEMVAAGQAEPLQPLPQIVVVIDELADLMMVVGKKIEELIARLAQKARAAGIHLILATQRPSVDVITGLIKANIPSRISFQVSSKVDSRTILDQMGAEALLGQGDMLFLSAGSGVPTRVHGAFVADEEVLGVVEYLRKVGGTQYDDRILEGADPDSGGSFTAGLDLGTGMPKGEGEGDALYDEAVAVVLKHRRASISLVQRHLRIGYNRAARLLEAMEQAGLVSAMQTNGNRDILVPAGKEV